SNQYSGGQCRSACYQRISGGNDDRTGPVCAIPCPAERTGSSRKPRRGPGKSVHELHSRLPDVQSSELEPDRRSSRRACGRDCGDGHVQRIHINGGRRGENKRTVGCGGRGGGETAARRLRQLSAAVGTQNVGRRITSRGVSI